MNWFGINWWNLAGATSEPTPSTSACPGAKLDADGVDQAPSPHRQDSTADAVDRLLATMTN